MNASGKTCPFGRKGEVLLEEPVVHRAGAAMDGGAIGLGEAKIVVSCYYQV